VEGLTLVRAEKSGMGHQDLCRFFLGIGGKRTYRPTTLSPPQAITMDKPGS
jgi:hypothetical protein